MQGFSLVVRGGALGFSEGCCCVSCDCPGVCDRTICYSYKDSVPPGRWYDECPQVGDCNQQVGDCAGDVLNGHIVQKLEKSCFDAEPVPGETLFAILKSGSTLDDYGTIAGVATNVQCGVLGRIDGDHDVTDQIDLSEDGCYYVAKLPISVTNSPTLGGPHGLANVCIEWKCTPPDGYCCNDYGVSYNTVSKAQCDEWGGTLYLTYQEAVDACGCGYCTLGEYPVILTPTREPGYPPPNPVTCGPGTNTGWSTTYNPVDDDFTSGQAGFYCYGTFCDPIQSYFDRGARIIGWFDLNQTRRVTASTECCTSYANFTSYKYRTFAWNCRTQSWDAITNIMAEFDSEYQNENKPDQYYLDEVCGSWPNGFATPAVIRNTRDPFCVTNPLP